MINNWVDYKIEHNYAVKHQNLERFILPLLIIQGFGWFIILKNKIIYVLNTEIEGNCQLKEFYLLPGIGITKMRIKQNQVGQIKCRHNKGRNPQSSRNKKNIYSRMNSVVGYTYSLFAANFYFKIFMLIILWIFVVWNYSGTTSSYYALILNSIR